MANVIFVNQRALLQSKYNNLTNLIKLWEKPNNTPVNQRYNYKKYWSVIEETEESNIKIQKFLILHMNILKKEQDRIGKINILLQNIKQLENNDISGLLEQLRKKYDKLDKIQNSIEEVVISNNEILEYINRNINVIKEEQDLISETNILINKMKKLLNANQVGYLQGISREEVNKNLPNEDDEIGQEFLKLHDQVYNERELINADLAKNNVGGKKRRMKSKTHKKSKNINKNTRKYIRN